MPQPRTPFVQRLIRWRFLFAINLLLVSFLGWTLGREYLQNREIRNEIAELQTQADALAARNIQLGELQTAVQTQSFIEREARLKLGMKKPGEAVVVIQQDDSGQGAGGSGQQTQESVDPLGLVLDGETTAPQVANSTKWWYYFFDKSAYRTLKPSVEL